MRVFLDTCVSTLSFLQFTLRRIRFYSIMQLACVFKYILEFGTLVETTRRATLSSSFFHSEFRSRSPILAFPAFREAPRIDSRRFHRFHIRGCTLRRICISRPISSDRDSSRSDLDRNAWEVRDPPPVDGKRPQFRDNWRLHPWNPSSSIRRCSKFSTIPSERRLREISEAAGTKCGISGDKREVF